MSEGRRSSRADAGTSPVVGAVLTLTITIGAVAAVMAWGLPMLQASQADATVEAVLEELRLLDDLTDAIARSGGGVTGEAVVTYDRGGLVLEDQAPIWAISYGVSGRAGVTLEAVADGDASYRIVNEGSANLSAVHVSHALLGDDGSTDLGSTQLGDLAGSASTEATIRNGTGAPVPVRGSAVRVRIHEFGIAPQTLVAEAWIVDPGAVRYTLSTADGYRELALTNGGIVVETPAGARAESPDAVRYVRSGSGPPRVFLSIERTSFDGPRSAGPGSWKLKAVAGATRSLMPSGVDATNLTIAVPDRAGAWQQAIWADHARSTDEGLVSPVSRAEQGVRFGGTVDLHVFYRRIAFPSGLQPS